LGEAYCRVLGWVVGVGGFVEAPLEVMPVVDGRAGEVDDVASGAIRGRGMRLKTEL